MGMHKLGYSSLVDMPWQKYSKRLVRHHLTNFFWGTKLATKFWTTLKDANLYQQLSIIEAHRGSTSFGISSRWSMNPTAPITCKYPKPVVALTYWIKKRATVSSLPIYICKVNFSEVNNIPASSWDFPKGSFQWQVPTRPPHSCRRQTYMFPNKRKKCRISRVHHSA